MKAREILRITGGRLLSGNTETEIPPSKISADSRTIKRGEFFLALNGANFRGSDFLEAAFKKSSRSYICKLFFSSLSLST